MRSQPSVPEKKNLLVLNKENRSVYIYNRYNLKAEKNKRKRLARVNAFSWETKKEDSVVCGLASIVRYTLIRIIESQWSLCFPCWNLCALANCDSALYIPQRIDFQSGLLLCFFFFLFRVCISICKGSEYKGEFVKKSDVVRSAFLILLGVV